jgi:hypothetical protein
MKNPTDYGRQFYFERLGNLLKIILQEKNLNLKETKKVSNTLTAVFSKKF